MSRQLALGGQPVLVAHWAEALSVVEEHAHLNRLLLVDAQRADPRLIPLVRAAAEHGCALLVCLGEGAEDVHRVVDAACEAAAPGGQLVATSWHDSANDTEAALDAFSLFSAWVGGSAGVLLLVTEDAGLDAILEAARKLRRRAASEGQER